MERFNSKNEDPIQFAEMRAKEKRNERIRHKNLMNSEYGRRKVFFASVRKGPIYGCVCCRRIRFRKGVDVYDDILTEHIENKYEDIINKSVGEMPCKLCIEGQ